MVFNSVDDADDGKVVKLVAALWFLIYSSWDDYSLALPSRSDVSQDITAFVLG